MKTVKRFDTHKIGKNVIVTPQGFLVIPAITARTGIQNYRDEKGNILREFRPESEVFSESSMSSLRTAVVTDGHPKEMVNPDNVQKLQVGHTNGIVTKKKIDGQKESFLATGLIITHRDAIEAIQAGKAELSNGYKVDLEFTPGDHDGEKFDAVQRNIVNNHIAIVWQGRAGHEVKLKLDHNDAIMLDENEPINPIQGDTMKIKINGKEFDVADELGQAITDEKAATETAHTDSLHTEKEKNKATTKKNEDLEKDKTSLEAKKDSLESDIEKLKKEPKKDGDVVNIDEAVQERFNVIAIGKKMLDGETVKNISSMKNDEIKKAVIKADSPEIDEKKLDKSEYVNARFDHISENLDTSADQVDKLGNKIVQKRKDGNKDPKYKTPAQVRQDNMDKQLEENNDKLPGRQLAN